jgi:hypothetical protein
MLNKLEVAGMSAAFCASVGILAVFSKCTGINALVAQAREILSPSHALA